MKSLFEKIKHPSMEAAVKVRPILAFSLVEVVVAVGIFAIGIVGVLGLLSPSIKSVSEVGDTAVANRLADNIQVELERVGFTAVTSATLPLYLVASKDGSRVLRYTIADPEVPATSISAGTYANSPADNGLSSSYAPAGIAYRDRYYLITVSSLASLPYTSGNGFIALSVKVSWPYMVPAGAATATASVTGDPYTKANATARSIMLLNMALRP